MQGDRHQHGYDLLAHLRRLETRIARLQKRWQTFRADPRPERLEEVREAFAAEDAYRNKLRRERLRRAAQEEDPPAKAEAKPEE